MGRYILMGREKTLKPNTTRSRTPRIASVLRHIAIAKERQAIELAIKKRQVLFLTYIFLGLLAKPKCSICNLISNMWDTCPL
jgi:hypothetical protein